MNQLTQLQKQQKLNQNMFKCFNFSSLQILNAISTYSIMQMHRKQLNFPYFTLEEFIYALKDYHTPSTYQILIKTNNKPPRFENAVNCLLAYYQNPTSFARGFKIMNEKVFGALDFEMKVECFSQCTAAALAKINNCIGFIPLGVDLQGQEYRIMYPGYLTILNSKNQQFNNKEKQFTMKQWMDQLEYPQKWKELDQILQDINYCLYSCDANGNYIYDEEKLNGVNVRLWNSEPETVLIKQNKESVNEAEIDQLMNKITVMEKIYQILLQNKLDKNEMIELIKTAAQDKNVQSQQFQQQFQVEENQNVISKRQVLSQKQIDQYNKTDLKSQEQLVKMSATKELPIDQQRLKLSQLCIQQQLEMLQFAQINLIEKIDETKDNIDMKIKIYDCRNNPQFIQDIISKIQVESMNILLQQLQGHQKVLIGNQELQISQENEKVVITKIFQELEEVQNLLSQLKIVFSTNYWNEKSSQYYGSLESHNPLQQLSDCKNYFKVSKIEENDTLTKFRFFHPKALWIGNNEVLKNLPNFVYEKQIFPELVENQPLREALGYCEQIVKSIQQESTDYSNEIDEDLTESSSQEDYDQDGSDEDFVPDEEIPDSDMTISSNEQSSEQQNDEETDKENKENKKQYQVKYVTWKKFNKRTMISLDEHKHMSLDIVVFHKQDDDQAAKEQMDQIFENTEQTQTTTQQETETQKTNNSEQIKPLPDDEVLVREYITPERRTQSWESLLKKLFPQEYNQGMKTRTIEQQKKIGKTIRYAVGDRPPLKNKDSSQVSKRQLKSENKQLVNNINKRWEEYRENNGEEAYEQAQRAKVLCKIIQAVIIDKNNSTGLEKIKQQLSEARSKTNTADPQSAYKFVDIVMKIVEENNLVDQMMEQELKMSQK